MQQNQKKVFGGHDIHMEMTPKFEEEERKNEGENQEKRFDIHQKGFDGLPMCFDEEGHHYKLNYKNFTCDGMDRKSYSLATHDYQIRDWKGHMNGKVFIDAWNR